ncbi:MAG: hypothetical protein HY608_08980 [Planctomycetes bacterium]|nr:hypothetical protein [Planctomycetota bacterium]
MTQPKPLPRPVHQDVPDEIARVLEGGAPYTIPREGHCRVVTNDGAAYLARRDYDAFVRKIPAYDLLIDGVRMKVFTRRGCTMIRKATLSPSEFVMISEYIVTGQPIIPTHTQAGRRRSPQAARKLFERARRKVDTCTGRRTYRFFKLHPAMDSHKIAFEFVPPEGTTYCLIVPIHR